MMSSKAISASRRAVFIVFSEFLSSGQSVLEALYLCNCSSLLRSNRRSVSAGRKYRMSSCISGNDGRVLILDVGRHHTIEIQRSNSSFVATKSLRVLGKHLAYIFIRFRQSRGLQKQKARPDYLGISVAS